MVRVGPETQIQLLHSYKNTRAFKVLDWVQKQDYILELDEKLLQGEVILSEWATFLVLIYWIF